MLTKQAAFFQTLHLGTIEIDGDRAFCRWGITEYIQPSGSEEGERNQGVYVDELRRTKGGWRFVRRDYRYVYAEKTLLRENWCEKERWTLRK